MSLSIQRLEVLLAGLLILLAGGVVVLTTVVRPPPRPAYSQATPAPVRAAATAALAQPAVPRDAPKDEIYDADAGGARLPDLDERVPGQAWPLLLLATGGIGLVLLAARTRRGRCMADTGQSFSVLLRAAGGRVLRDLRARADLSGELARAARPDRPWRLPALGRAAFQWPALTWPDIRLPAITGPGLPNFAVSRLQRWSLPFEQVVARLVQRVVLAPREEEFTAGSVTSASSHQNAASEQPLAEALSTDASVVAGSPEDRVLAVAAAVDALWRTAGYTSPVLAFDVEPDRGHQVVAVIDPRPDEEERLLAVPDLLAAQQPGWQARWAVDARGLALLTVECDATPPPISGPPLAPVIRHGRGGRTVRYLPLNEWRQLGIYGGGAQEALHALLTSVLYAQAPHELALALCDGGTLAPLYRGVAHLVTPAADSAELVRTLAGAVRRAPLEQSIRPLLLVVVEPDEATVAALGTLIKRLRQFPATPLCLILVQERIYAPGAEVYAQLPALITGPGAGPATLLPGRGEWPASSAARFEGRGLRLAGHALRLDEQSCATLLEPIRTAPASLPATIWDLQLRGQAAEGTERPAATSLATFLQQVNRAGSEASPLPRPVPARDLPLPPEVLRGLQPEVEPDNGWPCGPAPLGRAALADLLGRVVISPAITSGQANEVGVTKHRLAELLVGTHKAQAKELAEILVAWFDLAGILVAPTKPERLRHPRALVTTDLAEIAARLHTVPCPDRIAAAALWTETPGGQSV